MKKCAECVTVDLLFILFTLGGVDKLCERKHVNSTIRPIIIWLMGRGRDQVGVGCGEAGSLGDAY